MIPTVMIEGAPGASPATGPAQPASRAGISRPWQTAHAPHARHATVTAERIECQVLHVAGGPSPRLASDAFPVGGGILAGIMMGR
jgi:hypothetical protein